MRKLGMVMALMVLASILLVACNKPNPEMDALANCITENGATMYGTEWCPHCNEQKKRFGNSFDKIHYIDCDKYSLECTNAGVRGYPTWIVNGEAYTGAQSVERLAFLTGCSEV